MESFFINKAIDKALSDYLLSKDKEESILFNSFLVVVIRILINIYGELDIINPYQMKDELLFDNNLLKYITNKEKLDELKMLLDGFYVIDERNKKAVRREENVYFIDVQKKLIDIFNYKRINYGVTKDEIDDFYNLLYTSKTSNPLRLSYNFLNSSNIYEVDNYYQDTIVKSNKDNIGMLEKDINEQLYHTKPIYYVDVKKEENTVDVHINNELLTTGNGYVDILIIMSIIVTVVMVVVIFSSLIF